METIANVFQAEIFQRIGWTLVHFIWQAAAISVALAVVIKLLHKSSANLRYITACIGLALIVIVPAVTVKMIDIAVETPAPVIQTPVVDLPNTVVDTGPVVDMPMIELPTAPAPVKALPRIPFKDRFTNVVELSLPYLVIGWIFGVFGLSLWHLGGFRQLQRLRRQMVKQVTPALERRCKRLSDRLGINRIVSLVESALVQVPTVVGHFKPMILLPASALTGLSFEQIEAILAHELAHIKRHDYLVNILQTVVEILGFYHPAVWWVSHKIRVERENCCDDIAVELCSDKLCYAKALATMEEIRGRNIGLAVAASGGSLFDRIRRLLGKDSPSQSKLTWLPSVIAILLIVALIIPVALAMTSKQKIDIEPAKEISEFKKTLPNGVTVELVNSVLVPESFGNERVLSLKTGKLIQKKAAEQSNEPYLQYSYTFPPGANSSKHNINNIPEDLIGVVAGNMDITGIDLGSTEYESLEKLWSIESVDELPEIQPRIGITYGGHKSDGIFVHPSLDESWPYIAVFKGDDGTYGVFEVTEVKDRKVYVRFKTIKLPDEPAKEISEFKTTLPNDVTVEPDMELKYLSWQVDGDKNVEQIIWYPSGEIAVGIKASSLPVESFGGVGGHLGKALNMWFKGPSAEQSSARISIYNKDGELRDVIAGSQSKDGWIKTANGFTQEQRWPEQVDIKISYALGTWEDVTQFDTKKGAIKEFPITEDIKWDYEVSEGNLQTALSYKVAPNDDMTEYRHILIGHEDVKHDYNNSNIIGGGVRIAHVYKDLKPGDLGIIKIQRRQRIAKTFKNVSLQPGFKTDVQTKTEKPDIRPVDFKLDINSQRGICNLVVSIKNQSSAVIPEFKLRFYRGNPVNDIDEAGNKHSGWHGAGPIKPDKQWNEKTRDFHLTDGEYEFTVVLDYDNAIAETNENNNTASIKVVIEDGKIKTEKPDFPAVENIFDFGDGVVYTREVWQMLYVAKMRMAGLTKAYGNKDWGAVDQQAQEVRDVFRKFENALDVDEQDALEIKQLASSGKQVTKKQVELSSLYNIQLILKGLAKQESDPTYLYKLFYDIADISDELHDAIRDGKMELLGGYYRKLGQQYVDFIQTRSIRQLWSNINTKDLSPESLPEDLKEPFERVRSLKQRTESIDKMRVLGFMMVQYATKHQGQLPDNLEVLKPFDKTEIFAWALENVAYLGNGKTISFQPKVPIAYDKTLLNQEDIQGTNVLYSDFSNFFENFETLEKLGITKEENNKQQILTKGYILEVPADIINQLKDIVSNDKYQSQMIAPEKLEEFLKVVEATPGAKILARPKLIAPDGETGEIKTESTAESLNIKIINHVQPDKKSIKMAIDFEYVSVNDNNDTTTTNVTSTSTVLSDHAIALDAPKNNGLTLLFIAQPQILEKPIEMTGIVDAKSRSWQVKSETSDKKEEIEIEARFLEVPADANEIADFLKDMVANDSSIPVSSDPNFKNGILNDAQVEQLLKLSSAYPDSNLTAPKVKTLYGEMANISSTKTIKFGDKSADPNEVKKVKTGVTFQVKPTLQEECKSILLDFEFEQTNLLGFIGNLPQTEKTKIKSRVAVPNGGTFLLSGMKLTGKHRDGKKAQKTFLFLIKASKLESDKQ